jgi:peptide deformylase
VRRKLVYYGNDALRKKSNPVPEVTDDIRELARDLLETMYAENGAGLAAQQIGRTEAVCVVDVSHAPDAEGDADEERPEGVEMPLVMINPEIVEMDGAQLGEEGCLSFPEVYTKIRRAQTVRAEFTGLNGERHSVTGNGLLARAIQHELDHLNGVLLVDRMSHIQKVAVSGKLKRLKSENRPEAAGSA